MKETLKKIVPESMIAWIRGVQASVKLRRETIRQMKRFERNYAKRGSMRKVTSMDCDGTKAGYPGAGG